MACYGIENIERNRLITQVFYFRLFWRCNFLFYGRQTAHQSKRKCYANEVKTSSLLYDTLKDSYKIRLNNNYCLSTSY